MGERLYKLCTEIGIVSNERECMPQAMHHSAVFGWICALCGVLAGDTVAGYLYCACSNLVSASVRLVPLGQTDGQRILLEMRTAINLLVDVCLETDLGEIGSFAPLNEWASVEHETLYSRLFQS
jgi:urease accessory protein